jgi:hypothetical protein
VTARLQPVPPPAAQWWPAAAAAQRKRPPDYVAALWLKVHSYPPPGTLADPEQMRPLPGGGHSVKV